MPGLDEARPHVAELAANCVRVPDRYHRVAAPMPEVHARLDVAQLEPPVGAADEEVLDHRPGAASCRCEEAPGSDLPRLGCAQKLAVPSVRPQGEQPPEQIRPAPEQGEGGVDHRADHARPAQKTHEGEPVVRGRAVGAPGREARRNRADGSQAGDPVGHRGGTGERVRGPCRDTHHREPRQAELVGELTDVRGEVAHPAAGMRIGSAEPWAIHHQVPDPPAGDRFLEGRIALRGRADSSMEVEDRERRPSDRSPSS